MVNFFENITNDLNINLNNFNTFSLNLRGNTTATINVSVMVSSSERKFNPIIEPRRSYPLKSLEGFVDSNSEPSPLISDISRTRNLYMKAKSESTQITKPLIVTVKSSSGLESSMIGYVITNSGEVRKLGLHESIKQKKSKLTFSRANSFLQNNVNTYKTNKIHHRLRRVSISMSMIIIKTDLTKHLFLHDSYYGLNCVLTAIFYKGFPYLARIYFVI